MRKEINEKIKEVLNFAEKNNLYPEFNIVNANSSEAIVNGKKVLLFCSLNYLGLSNNDKLKQAAIEAIKKYGIGSGGSRFISGNFDLHEKLEKKIADFKKEEMAAIFQSGYATNIGVIPALFKLPKLKPFDLFKNDNGMIFSDELNHASIIDGCTLAKAKTVVYKHKDTNDLEKKLNKYRKISKKLIVTDGIFSMDGDIAPLDKIVLLAEKYGAMTMVDEAHATGVLGKNGSGTTEHFNLQGKVDIVMGTFSKAIGTLGGYIAGKKYLIRYLRATAKPSIFSVSLPPSIIASAIAAIEEIKQHPELRKKLLNNGKYVREELEKIGFNTLGSETNIVPILIGDEKKTIEMTNLLFEKNIFAPCVRWPAVAKGKARIRFSPMSTHTKEQLDTLIVACREIGNHLKII
ncbi:MAG: 8-amino-7-oxononanoate synthase [Candidatus Pacebacteria bacterium]|jgi:8-amino-7-oxononanoate synthase|nr:8-amino-7-oxononanoate synthase [Candidatus Paceibacterota bacterium]